MLLLDGIGHPVWFAIASFSTTEITDSIAPVPPPAVAWFLVSGITAIGGASPPSLGGPSQVQ